MLSLNINISLFEAKLNLIIPFLQYFSLILEKTPKKTGAKFIVIKKISNLFGFLRIVKLFDLIGLRTSVKMYIFMGVFIFILIIFILFSMILFKNDENYTIKNTIANDLLFHFFKYLPFMILPLWEFYLVPFQLHIFPEWTKLFGVLSNFMLLSFSIFYCLYFHMYGFNKHNLLSKHGFFFLILSLNFYFQII